MSINMLYIYKICVMYIIYIYIYYITHSSSHIIGIPLPRLALLPIITSFIMYIQRNIFHCYMQFYSVFYIVIAIYIYIYIYIYTYILIM